MKSKNPAQAGLFDCCFASDYIELIKHSFTVSMSCVVGNRSPRPNKSTTSCPSFSTRQGMMFGGGCGKGGKSRSLPCGTADGGLTSVSFSQRATFCQPGGT